MRLLANESVTQSSTPTCLIHVACFMQSYRIWAVSLLSCRTVKNESCTSTLPSVAIGSKWSTRNSSLSRFPASALTSTCRLKYLQWERAVINCCCCSRAMNSTNVAHVWSFLYPWPRLRLCRSLKSHIGFILVKAMHFLSNQVSYTKLTLGVAPSDSIHQWL